MNRQTEKFITVGDYQVLVTKEPSCNMLNSIALQHGNIADKVIRGLTNTIYRAKSSSDYFAVLLLKEKDYVIGYASFIQNSIEPSKWFYTDLWVASEYRRQGIATQILKAGINQLVECHAKFLYCTVEPHNEASIRTQYALGFTETKTEPFEFFMDMEGLIMFQKQL